MSLVLCNELYMPWRDELLKGLSTSEPSAPAEFGVWTAMDFSGRDIGKIRRVADYRTSIPGIRKLGAAGFVDAAGVNPHVPKAVRPRNGTSIPDLG